MKKLLVSIFLVCSLLLLGTPSKVVYIPNTTYNAQGVLHFDADNYFIQGNTNENKSEFGLTMQFLPFKKFKFVAGVDYKAYKHSPIYLSGKFVIPMNSLPNLALGVFNVGVNSSDLKPIYYLLLSKRIGFYGKILFGGYIGDKGELRDSQGEADNKGFLVGYEVYLNKLSKNLYFGSDYFSGDNRMSAVSLGVGWKFARNVLLKFAYHIKLRKSENNQLSLQININAF